ncbi:MAG: tetratricopeptide repeat protein [bacterium]
MTSNARIALFCAVALSSATACKPKMPSGGGLADSALASLRRGDTASGLKQLDDALAADSTSARAHRLRGDIARNRAEYDKALVDYDAAIRFKPDDAGIFVDRAMVHQAKGDYEPAIQDFDRAVTLRPNYALAFKNRGRTHFYMGHFKEAGEDLGRGAALDSTNAYVAIWQHMAVKRNGGDNTAELTTQLAKTDPAKWPAPVGQFYLGKLTAAQLTAAGEKTDSPAQADQRCAVAFYVGESALWNKQPADAKKRFEEAVASCPTSFTEYEGAQAELKRLSK